ncbi:MAG: hypothetical protein AVDCRST_MAG64-2061 [uncultured Phycisphaerae bacterium]|uniref:Uncharacterized protein n=1 Tax=uncultured Phycisphaerae bacterium TaxID=904963 RepID=A0A6J4NMR6_9BACT|nr:MAG: hypothetical protein AVDCRST_MAG64-2061 [uncultured Phycisphaerae bacterium]
MMTTPDTHPDPAPLGYGRRAPLHRRRAFRWCVRAALLAALVAAISGAWREHAEPRLRERARRREVAREQARMLTLQQEWMAYRAPANRVVFAEPPDLVSRLQAVGQYHDKGMGPAGDLPACRRAWPFGSIGNHEPPLGARHGAVASAKREAVLFLHHRRTPNGHDRVVLLVVEGRQCYGERFGPSRRRELPSPSAAESRPTTVSTGRDLFFRYTIVETGPWNPTPPPVRAAGGWVFPPDLERFQQPITLFAGQPDPADPTHFTIDYEYDGQPGTIDGHLRDGGADGLSTWIGFVVRDGPVGPTPDATPPSDAVQQPVGDR